MYTPQQPNKLQVCAQFIQLPAVPTIKSPWCLVMACFQRFLWDVPLLCSCSNGLQYIINPEEMQNVVLPISYTDRNGNLQTITFTCGITRPVSNAQAREPIAKSSNVLLLSTTHRIAWSTAKTIICFRTLQYNSIIKSKALNRAQLVPVDIWILWTTLANISSTNTFSSDGALWEENILAYHLVLLDNRNEIADVITNQVQPALIPHSQTVLL
jgi:hypothetical protein